MEIKLFGAGNEVAEFSRLDKSVFCLIEDIYA
jgi:hypothetical protein